jgi:hypothetical protein
VTGGVEVRQFGAPAGETIASAVATGPSGDLHVVGHTDTSLAGHPPTGTCDAFLASFDRSGSRPRLLQFGAPGRQTYAYAVATDAEGGIYLTGYTKGSLDGRPPKGICDAFLARFDNSGNRCWILQLGARDSVTVGSAVVVDPGGRIYLAGWTLGGLEDHALIGESDGFLARVGRDGCLVQVRQFGARGAETVASAVATDAVGNVFVAGHTTGTLEPGAKCGISDGFLSRYDRDGHWVTTRQLGAPGATTSARAEAVDACGAVLVAGDTFGGLDGGTRIGYRDAFLARFDAALGRHGTVQLGHPGKWTWASALAVGSDGRARLAGTTNGHLDGPCARFWDLFLAEFEGPGRPARLRQLGVTDPQAHVHASGVAVDADGHAHIAGYTNAAFGGSRLHGAWDAYLARLAPDAEPRSSPGLRP